MMRVILFAFFFSIVSRVHAQITKTVYNDPQFISTILQQHETYRSELGLPALSWSPALAKDALAWAQHLAEIDKGEHDQSVRGHEGENLWWGTADAFSYAQMVDMWGSEKKSFRYDVFPNCTTRHSAVVGHYTQMIWRTTRSIGCALASNGKTDFMVCRYSPPGNVIGQKPY